MTTQTSPLDPLIGAILANRYQIEHRLGEGAMGAVYRARHIKIGRLFAVKILHAKLLSDPKVAQRFEREAELAGRLRHPNVIGVVDVGETEGVHYMVMDFVEGTDLAELLPEAPMAAARIMNLTRQLLEGLFHAHEQGLIHRDLKPENIIIERDAHGHEVPRIVDFGIAILREGDDSPDGQGRLTTNGLVLGTPHYMAPEQAIGDPIDHRIDLFALGIIIYEMLCAKLPFDGTGVEVARANMLLDPPMIAQRVPDLEVDPLLEAFAHHLMAKARDRRPPTARAARELLDLIERDRAAAAVALGVPRDARRPAITQDRAPSVARPSDLETSITRALPHDAGRSRRRLVIGGLVALIASVSAVAIITRDKHEDDHAIAVATNSSKIAPLVTPIAPDAVSEPAPIVDVAPPPAKVTPPEPKPHPDRRPEPKHPVKPPTPTNPEPLAGNAQPPIKVPSVSVAELVTIYQAVGRDIETLRSKQGEDAIRDVQPRYRRVNLNDAMATAARRDAAFDLLAKLQHDIRTKLK